MLFSFNTSTNPSRIKFSNESAVETWTAGDYIDVRPGDKEEIYAAVVFGDDIIIFKETSIWKLTGKSKASFALYQLDNSRGTTAPHGVGQLRGRLIFWEQKTGFWAFDGAGFELISQNVNSYFKESITDDFKAWAVVFGDRYYWFGKSIYAPNNLTLAYYAGNNVWEQGWEGMFCGLEYNGSLYGSLHDNQGTWKEVDDSDSYGVTSGNTLSHMRTGWFRSAGPGAKARVRRIEITLEGFINDVFTVRLYTDYDESTAAVSKTVTFTSNGLETIALDGWGPRLHSFQIGVETSHHAITLHRMSVFYTGNLDVVGDRTP
jgi:hypothetical protein